MIKQKGDEMRREKGGGDVNSDRRRESEGWQGVKGGRDGERNKNAKLLNEVRWLSLGLIDSIYCFRFFSFLLSSLVLLKAFYRST